MKKRGLGRNLDVLLSRSKPSVTIAENQDPASDSSKEALHHLAVELLQRGRYQPRKEIQPETIRELADSIRAQGIIQPIVVRKIAGDRYEIIAGERRWRAAQLAGLTEVPVLIKNIPDEAALAVALIENIQRENLNPIEEAIALQRLLDEFSMTHQQVADAVGKSRATVSNLLRLLSLSAAVKVLLEEGQLEMGHARALLTLSIADQAHLAQKVVTLKLSVRETERLVQQQQNPTTINKELTKRLDPNLQKLQQTVSDQLGTSVQFRPGPKGKGKMVVYYKNADQLEKILARLTPAAVKMD